MSEPDLHQESDAVCESWQRFIQATLGIAILVGTGLLAHFYAPQPNDGLKEQVAQLNRQVQQLKQEQALPAVSMLNQYRDSIGYVYGVYRVSMPGQVPSIRARISGTAFVVSHGLLATNRHVAEPWYGDSEALGYIKKGGIPELEQLLAFFPGSPTPVDVIPVTVSAQGDLAILRMADSNFTRQLAPLPLASVSVPPGEVVTVIGYPMGIAGMVAKSPSSVYERLAYRRADIGAANELAALSLIRPSATYGHLGDIVGEKLIYDAPTAHGGSGGPVLNSRGEVIGVNSAYMDGFSGGTLGVSVTALKPLIAVAQKKSSPPDLKTPAPTPSAAVSTASLPQ
jgi:S1-C subfamily serine protease